MEHLPQAEGNLTAASGGLSLRRRAAPTVNRPLAAEILPRLPIEAPAAAIGTARRRVPTHVGIPATARVPAMVAPGVRVHSSTCGSLSCSRDLPAAMVEVMEDIVARRVMAEAGAAIAVGRPAEVILLAEVVAMPAAADIPEAEATDKSIAAVWFVLSKSSCCKRSEDRGEKGVLTGTPLLIFDLISDHPFSITSD